MYNYFFFCIETDIPVLLFEDDGSLVYSPVSKIRDQCSEMERRINEMKEKRENLSPTGKQLSFIYSWASTNGDYFYCCVFCHAFLLSLRITLTVLFLKYLITYTQNENIWLEMCKIVPLELVSINRSVGSIFQDINPFSP